MTALVRTLAAALCLAALSTADAAERPNILLITVDDMSCDSVGAFGCRLEGTSPHMDALAASGLRFQYAHVQVGNCMPSRNAMLSGRYPHNNGVEGFYQVRGIPYPVLSDLMQRAGYLTAIRHKVSHSTPYSPYPGWDLVLDQAPDGRRRDAKNPQSYGESVRQTLQAARAAGKPFCLNVNIADPHKPFYAEGQGGATIPDDNVPTRVFAPEEVPVPGFLPDDPVVRKELAHYYSSVRRADDCLGEVLQALDAEGAADSTVVMFLSDHGMPLPFAKTQLYHHSTHTPLIVRWPGVVRPGTVDSRHMVGAVDIFPTLLDIAAIPHPEGIDSRSFAPLLKGETQEGRDYVFKEYNENSGGSRDPMRSVQSRQFCYIFNPWSDGKRSMATATKGTSTYRQMQQLARTDPQVAARLALFDHRVLEEFYDVEADPDALVNLIDDPRYQQDLDRHRRVLEEWMTETKDPVLDVFQRRDKPDVLAKFMRKSQQEADERRGGGGRNRRGAAAGRPKAQRDDLIALELPTAVRAGQQVEVTVSHTLPPRLRTQQVHVTLKAGADDRRVDRKVIEISGTGSTTVTFDVPAGLTGNLRFAAFVGKDYPSSLQHINSRPVPVK